MDATAASFIVEARKVWLQPRPSLDVIGCFLGEHRWVTQVLPLDKIGVVITRTLEQYLYLLNQFEKTWKGMNSTFPWPIQRERKHLQVRFSPAVEAVVCSSTTRRQSFTHYSFKKNYETALETYVSSGGRSCFPKRFNENDLGSS